MKYQKEISKSFTKVWEDFYINYLALFNILNPVYKKYKEFKKKRMEKQYQSMNFSNNVDSQPLLDSQSPSRADIRESSHIRDKFKEQFLVELQKVDFFYNENINKVIRPKLKEIKEQLNHSLKVNEFRIHNETFEMAIKEVYKDVHLINNYIEINLEIKDKLLDKYKKYFGIYSSNKSKKVQSKNSQIILEDDNENDENEDLNNDELDSVVNNFISFNFSIH